MFSCKAFFPGALLAAAFSTQAEGLDLSYPQPPLPATPIQTLSLIHI